MSRSRFLVFASLVTTIACAEQPSDLTLSVDQEADAIHAVTSSNPGLEGAALQVTLFDGLGNETAPAAPATSASPETSTQDSSEVPPLSSGTHTTEVRAVLSAPNSGSGIQVGDLVDISIEESPFEGQYTLDGFVTVRQEGHQIVGYGAAEFRSVGFDCTMEVWRDVSGTIDETGTLALTFETDTVVSGKECAMSPFGEARWDVEDYLVSGTL